jgi:hypothetical protein
VARYPVGCGAEEAGESGGGGDGEEAHLFSPPLLLANAAGCCCRARLHAAVRRSAGGTVGFLADAPWSGNGGKWSHRS